MANPSSGTTGHGTSGTDVQGLIGGSPEQPIGSLPFTGQELGLIIIAAIAIILLGIWLRYQARLRSDD